MRPDTRGQVQPEPYGDMVKWGLCSAHPQKRCFDTHKEARAEVKRLRSEGGSKGTPVGPSLHAFRCLTCGFIHIGNKPPKNTRKLP